MGYFARCMRVLLALPMASAGIAQELQLRQAENLNLAYYGKGPEYLSYHLARSFENSMAFHRRLFNYTPTQPVSILLQDWGDFGHGGTSTMPWNYSRPRVITSSPIKFIRASRRVRSMRT